MLSRLGALLISISAWGVILEIKNNYPLFSGLYIFTFSVTFQVNFEDTCKGFLEVAKVCESVQILILMPFWWIFVKSIVYVLYSAKFHFCTAIAQHDMMHLITFIFSNFCLLFSS